MSQSHTANSDCDRFIQILCSEALGCLHSGSMSHSL
uniref:Uncharacterized protein n=1 Tax=Anguilla anguilla TaxID=7936 RepID=A0A0E9VYS5_ANGAN